MAELLWKPSEKQIADANMTRFIQFVNDHFGRSFDEYNQLYDWSVNDIPGFWGALWAFLEVIHSKDCEDVVWQ